MNVLERLDAAQPWTQEETMLLDSVKQLAAEKIAPRAAHYDKTAEFPWDNVKEINNLG
jgi:alkylation response protein AidB-like acyl-CoA dehydrogenase